MKDGIVYHVASIALIVDIHLSVTCGVSGNSHTIGLEDDDVGRESTIDRRGALSIDGLITELLSIVPFAPKLT